MAVWSTSEGFVNDRKFLQELLVRLAVLETRLDERSVALTIQATEYERRLHDLNNAHRDQAQRNADYVSREAWDLRTSEWMHWRQEVDKRNAEYVSIDKWEAHAAEWARWRQEIDRWRWIAVGVGGAAGGVSGLLARVFG